MKSLPARAAVFVLGLGYLLFLGGCTLLEPRQDTSRFFVLSATAGPTNELPLAVSVGPVRLPDYLLRPEIVRRAGENLLEPSSTDRWAEAIDRAFVRVLCLDLATRMPRATVVAFPPSASENAALEVEIEVAAFEGNRSGDVRLDARWILRDLRTGSRAVHEAALSHTAASGGTPEVVAAMSALLGELADGIARELGTGR